jgi:C-terminal processing protease CtpA/Prc
VDAQKPDGPAAGGAQPGVAKADTPDAPALSEAQVRRLATLSKLWGTVRYFHPRLAYNEIDWDGALARAAPRVAKAKTPKEYADAVGDMLAVLGDPATAVAHLPAPAGMAPGQGLKVGAGKLFSWAGDGILAVQLTDPQMDLTLYVRRAELPALAKEIRKARAVIFDLRDGAWPVYSFRLEKLETALPSRALVLPAHRYLVHSGYRAQGFGSTAYGSAFQTDFLETLRPADGNKRRTVFLVNARSEIPPLALALQQAGDAFLVAQGKLAAAAGVRSRTFPLADGYSARVRLTELVDRTGAEASARIDAEVPADADRGPDGPAFKAALALLADPDRGRPPSKAGKPLPPAVWSADRAFPEMAYPDLGHRLLAVSRLWNVIHYFYPYHHLIDDWDAVLPEFLPKFAAARDARAYALAVAEMATRIPDNHTRVSGSRELQQFFGEFLPPVALRLIDGEPVVTEVWGEAAKAASGPRVGDVVVRVDGEPVAERMASYGKYLAASTPATHKRNILRLLLGGPKSAPVKLIVRRAGGALKEVEAPRGEADWRTRPKPTVEVVRTLPDHLVYADLSRLTVAGIDPLFDKLKDARGLILDMRGYPIEPVGFSLAPRLNTKKARHAAAFQRRLVSDDGTPRVGYHEAASFAFLQPLMPSSKEPYRGKVVMLIDERTQSAAEHTCLHIEAACGPTFIGSHTSGANGDVTTLVLPGGLTVMFTGHDVRHADGRQLQRIGLVPHIEVAPTLRGVREGRDEVLERATRFLREGK